MKKLSQVQKKFQGGLSEDIVRSEQFQRYVGNGKYVCGYLGTSERTTDRDRVVEEELKRQGLEAEGVALWMTSTDGRHLMDDVPKSLKSFRKRVQAYVDDAFVKVTIWAHPDHCGTMASTIKLGERIAQAFRGR